MNGECFGFNDKRYSSTFEEIIEGLAEQFFEQGEVSENYMYGNHTGSEDDDDSNYCLITLKAGQFVNGISGDKYDSIVGDGNFDVSYWGEFDTLEIGDIVIDVTDVSSVMTLSNEEYNDAKQYGHLVV